MKVYKRYNINNIYNETIIKLKIVILHYFLSLFKMFHYSLVEFILNIKY
jgi:hypothetical protein